MNYEEMSDFEVNKAVSGLVDFGGYIVTVNEDCETVYLCEKDGAWDMLPVGHFNPCNNPSDAWPIIVENDITVRGGGVAYYDGNERPAYIVRHKNPLRAAMICFLKIKDAEQ